MAYDDPPPPMRWSFDTNGGAWWLAKGITGALKAAGEMPRPSAVQQTPSGPMAVGALPDGFVYDQWGNAVYTDGTGQRWTFDDEGAPARIEYSGGVVTGAVGAAAGPASVPSVTITPATKAEIDAGTVPIRMLTREYRQGVKTAVRQAERESTRGFATTSPGTIPQDAIPAAMGGPLNDPNWLGSDLLREQLEAQFPDWSPEQINDYIVTYTRRDAVRRGALAQKRRFIKNGLDKDLYQGSAYQRYALQKSMMEGNGRPQYGSGAEYRVLNMDQLDLIQLQQQMIAAKIPGSSSIVLGQVGALDGEDATIVAFRNVLAQANLQGVNFDAYLAGQVQMAKLAERAGLQDGSPGDPKFDPVRVQEVVNLTGKARARAQLKTMMAQMLGRAPTEAEVNDYLDRLNEREKADPTVVTTTYQRDGDSSRTTEATDVDPIALAENRIKNQNPKEYEAQQRLNYYNGILELMGGA
jgi:hypothetical protein